MGAVEIVIIVLAVLAVAGFIVGTAVRKLKGKPTGDCACCPHAKTCDRCCETKHIDLSKYEGDQDKPDRI